MKKMLFLKRIIKTFGKQNYRVEVSCIENKNKLDFY